MTQEPKRRGRPRKMSPEEINDVQEELQKSQEETIDPIIEKEQPKNLRAKVTYPCRNPKFSKAVLMDENGNLDRNYGCIIVRVPKNLKKNLIGKTINLDVQVDDAGNHSYTYKP